MIYIWFINSWNRIWNILACLRIELKVGQNNENGTNYFSPEWTLGSCYGPHVQCGHMSTCYERYPIQSELCCLSPGRHTLTCINRKSQFGWGNFTFEIDGKRYCDDFVGFKAMRTILVEGNK